MPLNRDDIISEVAVSGSSGISCNRAEIVIDPVKRTLRVNFNLVKITVLSDNRYFEEQQMPITVDLEDGTGTKNFVIYNRRTGRPMNGNPTMSYDMMSRNIMSLFFDTAAKAGVA
jgi:hypothetical protein